MDSARAAGRQHFPPSGQPSAEPETDMRQITLSLRDETIASLNRDFEAFLRLSLKLDPQFITPSFEDYLRAKLLDNDTPLTEQAVQRMLTHGQYAWAKRALDKEFPDVVEILIRQAAEHGFAFAIRSDWSAEDLVKASREWATAIVTEANGDASQVDVLASQIKSAAMDIREVEQKMQTPAWRVADSLRQRVFEAKIAVETNVGSAAREKLGELRALLRLGIFYGSIQKQEAQQLLEYLRSLRPELFIDEPYDGFTRFAAWLRSIFGSAPRTPRASRASR